MAILLVGQHRLAAPLYSALAEARPQGSVRQFSGRDPAPFEGPFPDTAQLRGESAASTASATPDIEAAGLLAGVETVVLLPPPIPPGSDDAQAAEGGPWLDQATRGTYDILRAAVCAGSKRVVCLSTMALFEPYAENLLVDVQYKPLPTTAPGPLGAPHTSLHSPQTMLLFPCPALDTGKQCNRTTDSAKRKTDRRCYRAGCYLQEFISREFGRLGLLKTVIARLGLAGSSRWPLE
eukprot:SAG31_NODE_11667_length_1008_cov_0.927393_1_plen_235_part_01